MIKTALVAMTLMGCDCDAKLCEFISETPAQWTSVADCETAMKTQLAHKTNYDYPLISGLCRTTRAPTPQMVVEAPTGVDQTATTSVVETRSGGLLTNLEAGTRTIFKRTASGYSYVSGGLGVLADRALGVVKSVGRFVPDRIAGL